MGRHTPYTVSLSQEEKEKLLAMSNDNTLSARVSKPVLILLTLDNKKLDSEYIRCGTCSIFVFAETLADYRPVSVRRQRTSHDWAEENFFPLSFLAFKK
ncbi:MAG: hypothetical protein ACOCNC_13275 [Acetivibrio ethanolgignens]